jgi:hypothetical protein
MPVIAVLIALLCTCEAAAVDARLSGAVALTTTAGGTQQWLRSPQAAFVEAWVRFPAGLSDSTVFGIDQELIDGVSDPHFTAGGDWMGLTGVSRSGMLWVAAGSAATTAGIPSGVRSWQLMPLGQALQPDTWYRIRNVVDFSRRRFVSFTITGPGIDRTINLGAHLLDFPNTMPFDRRALARFVWAMDGAALGGSAGRPSRVFFDDISWGHLASPDAAPQAGAVITDDCETGAPALPVQPLPAPGTQPYIIPLAGYTEGRWYLERPESLCARLEAGFARSGNHVIACDASLASPTYDGWLAKVRKAAGPAQVRQGVPGDQRHGR